MIGTNEMTWTAICERNGLVGAVCFNSENDAEAAFKNIFSVIQCDGYRVMCLLKGDQTKTFYSVDSARHTVSSDNMLSGDKPSNEPMDF